MKKITIVVVVVILFAFCVWVFFGYHCETLMLWEVFDRVKDEFSLRATLWILYQNRSPVVQGET